MDGTLNRTQTESKTNKDLWSLGTLPILALGTFSGVLGVYWDIAWHTDIGRDSFFSPPHNFIYGSMLIVFLMGIYTLLRDRRNTSFHLQIGRSSLQPGIVIVALGSALTFMFAPADDLWHRLFGTEVTLWAPMHLVGLLGLTTACLGGLITSRIEGQLAARNRKRLFSWLSVFFASMLLAYFMLFLAEYEFGYPVYGVWLGVALLLSLPTFVLAMMAKLKPVPWSATLTALGFTAFRLLLAAWLMTTDSVFGWAGATRPMIPVLFLAGLAADILVKRGANAVILGSVLGLFSFFSNWLLLSVTGTLNWYPAALALGVPVGLALSVVTAYLGVSVAGALEPPAQEEQGLST